MADDTVVIDGNAAINASLVANPFADWSHVRLVAPTLLWSEVASGLSQLRWRGEITAQQATEALVRLLEAPIEYVDSSELAVAASEFARERGWAKTYDAEYVVLAIRRGAPLLTVDARLGATVRADVKVVSPADVAAGAGAEAGSATNRN